MQKNQNHFLHFSRRERSGIIVLLFISILARVIPYFIDGPSVEIPAGKIDEWRELKLISDTPARYTAGSAYQRADEISEGELFTFDPNTLDEAGWMRLGISARTAASIRKYVSKGGRFYRAADIGKIYGLKPGKAKQLEPFVRIEEAKKFVYPSYEKKEYKPQQKVVDINLADSSAFESLPGIGATLSKRIITFREKLGGFYSIAQVGEVYGLHDSTFQKIKGMLRIAPFEVKKININTADKEVLQLHPYIRYKVASLIVAYREQHGKFGSVDDLKNIQAITTEMLNKMQPYLDTGS